MPVRDEQGRIIRWFGTSTDIDDTKHAEALERESAERYRTLVEQVKDYAIFRMDPKGLATTWNEGVRRLLGFEEAEFIGKDIVSLFFTAEDVQDGVAEREFAEAAATGKASNDRWKIRKDGTRFFAMGITTALHDEAGQLIGFTKIMQDQTEQKRLEEELRQFTAELAEADRRKNEFLAMLAHELRNPLAAVGNAVQVLTAPTWWRCRRGRRRSSSARSNTSRDWSTTCSTSRGSPRVRSSSEGADSTLDHHRAAVEAAMPLIEEKGHDLTFPST